MDKTALIIGGTKGLGLSLAWGAYTRRIKPIITGRSVDPYIDLGSATHFPPLSDFFWLDLANPDSVEQISQRNIGPLDYVFWVAGNFSRKPLEQMPRKVIDNMIATHLSGPARALQLLHLMARHINKRPYHLVTIASTSSWRIRENETLYCALKAAKAAFTRNFAIELIRDLPGSKVTLVNPGGMKTSNFWQDSGQDISRFMNPDEITKIIWSEVKGQEAPFKEVQIMRNDDGSPSVSYGSRTPELPSELI